MRKFITLDVQDGIILNGPTKKVRVNTDYIVEYRAVSDTLSEPYTMVTVQQGERVVLYKAMLDITIIDSLVGL